LAQAFCRQATLLRRRIPRGGLPSMSAPWAISVRNTFVCVWSPDEGGSPVRKIRSEPPLECGADRTAGLAPLPLPRRGAEDDGARGSRPAEDRGGAREARPGERRGGRLALGGVLCGTSGSLSSTRSFDHRDGSFLGSEPCNTAAPGSGLSRELSGLSSASSTSADTAGAVEAAMEEHPPSAVPGFVRIPVVVPVVLLLPVIAEARPPAGGPAPLAVTWTVDADLLEREEPRVESPRLLVDIPGLGQWPFQIILYAAAAATAAGKRGRPRALGFKRSRGHGRVEVRSLTQLPRGAGRFTMGAVVGTGDRARVPRPPAPHDFSEQACCPFRRVAFCDAVDPAADAGARSCGAPVAAPARSRPLHSRVGSPTVCIGIGGPRATSLKA